MKQNQNNVGYILIVVSGHHPLLLIKLDKNFTRMVRIMMNYN